MKFKKVLLISSIVLLSIAIIFAGIALTYKLVKQQGVIVSYSVNSDKSNNRILIATQQSSFKDSVLKKVVDHYTGQPIYLYVTDVTQLKSIKFKDWDRIIFLTTIESSKINQEVENFLKNENDLKKVSMFITADSGQWKNKTIEIDAITSASKLDNADTYANGIIESIEKNLK